MYEKQTWNVGDTITEDKLNHVEDGIANAGGVLVCNVIMGESNTQTLETSQQRSSNTGIFPEGTKLDKTWQQINDANLAIIVFENSYIDDSEELPISGYQKEIWPIMGVGYGGDSEHGEYRVITNNYSFLTDSPEGYPEVEDGRK